VNFEATCEELDVGKERAENKLLGSNEGLHGFKKEMKDLESREKFEDNGKGGREGKMGGKLREKRIKSFGHLRWEKIELYIIIVAFFVIKVVWFGFDLDLLLQNDNKI